MQTKEKKKATFSFFDKFSFSDDEEEEVDEFQITAVKGKSLLKFVSSNEFDYCKLKCYVYTGEQEPTEVMKSKKISISKTGKAL